MRSISNPDELGRARFETSVARLAQLPPDRGREVAFAGRSNSGKSSVLNRITGHQSLARTSKTPGRTQLLNVFRLDAGPALIDLPGYGYARVPADIQAGWDVLLGGYLRTRRALAGVVLVMDSRHPCGLHDLQLIEFCAQAGREVHVLLNKCDKLGHQDRLRTLETTRGAVGARHPDVMVQLFSAKSGEGLDEIRSRLNQWLELPSPPGKKNPGNKGKDSGALK